MSIDELAEMLFRKWLSGRTGIETAPPWRELSAELRACWIEVARTAATGVPMLKKGAK